MNINKYFENKFIVLIARIILGGLFILASIDKIIYADSFAISIMNYKIIGQNLALITATILPALELFCGLFLILGIYTKTNAILITSLLAIFTLMIISALVRGLDISCGCFTQDPEASKIGYLKILENTAMILIGVYLIKIKNYGFELFSSKEKL